jgi:hypothetical protein
MNAERPHSATCGSFKCEREKPVRQGDGPPAAPFSRTCSGMGHCRQCDVCDAASDEVARRNSGDASLRPALDGCAWGRRTASVRNRLEPLGPLRTLSRHDSGASLRQRFDSSFFSNPSDPTALANVVSFASRVDWALEGSSELSTAACLIDGTKCSPDSLRELAALGERVDWVRVMGCGLSLAQFVLRHSSLGAEALVALADCALDWSQMGDGGATFLLGYARICAAMGEWRGLAAAAASSTQMPWLVAADGHRAIDVIVAHHQEKIFDALMCHVADASAMEALDSSGQSIVHRLCAHGRVSEMSAILANDVVMRDLDLNAVDGATGQSGPFMAVLHGHLGLVKVMSARRVNWNVRDKVRGATAWMYAAFEGRLDVIEFAARGGVAVDWDVEDDNGLKAVHYAKLREGGSGWFESAFRGRAKKGGGIEVEIGGGVFGVHS